MLKLRHQLLKYFHFLEIIEELSTPRKVYLDLGRVIGEKNILCMTIV